MDGEKTTDDRKNGMETSRFADNPIYVTRPFLPPLDRFVDALKDIWDRGVLTNNGPVNRQLEERLSELLGVSSVALVSNGSIALELAVEAFGLEGEVITTPYSFVATSHSLLRRGLKPRFVDIDPHTFNIDPAQVRGAIGPDTAGILAVHCYGTPCDVTALEEIGREHGIPVIYDAAHAFAVRKEGRSIFEWGDCSTVSFHATKTFQTFEGGAIAFPDPTKRTAVDALRNFGIAGEEHIPNVGTNAKMSEIAAAMGLLQLDYVEENRASRRAIDAFYREMLCDVAGIVIPKHPEGVLHNYSYFPILVTGAFPATRDQLYERLREREIYSRKYFWPLLSSLPMYRGLPSADLDLLPNANRVAQMVLCLPLYSDLPQTDAMRVVDVIRNAGGVARP